MSDLNDLIHTNAHRAYEQGVQREQERVLKMLDVELNKVKAMPFAKNDAKVIMAQIRAIEKVTDLIKGEQK
jgi:hypothetical protein